MKQQRDEISGRRINWNRPTPQSFWTYQASAPTPPAPGYMSQTDWETLSPGMRREIVRQAEKGGR